MEKIPHNIFVCKKCKETEMPQKEKPEVQVEEKPKITTIKISQCKNKDYMYKVKIGNLIIDEIGHMGNCYLHKNFGEFLPLVENFTHRQFWK